MVPGSVVGSDAVLSVPVTPACMRSRTSSIPALAEKNASCSSRKLELMLVSVLAKENRAGRDCANDEQSDQRHQQGDPALTIPAALFTVERDHICLSQLQLMACPLEAIEQLFRDTSPSKTPSIGFPVCKSITVGSFTRRLI